ncbi:MAG TPA: hypothetical protein VGP18_10550 [Solirubrobacteraceae bacterium]|jgi:hypothetical protein|nr:hypothetical protein [Solirubrobacteraceae bacterium]
MLFKSAVLFWSLALMRTSNETRNTMPSTVVPHPPAGTTPNGIAPTAVADPVPDPQPNRAPRSPLLAKLTSLTSIATVAAAGMIVVGALALVGGHYDKQVVHDQLAPQKIFFPKPATNPGLAAYAGQQVLTGKQAKLYAQKQIGVDLTKVAGGKTYSQVSAEWIAGGMKNTTLAGERTTLFMGETLNGLLLNAWGWSVIGMIATLAGWILILLGAVLFLLPLANWQVNLIHRRSVVATA